MNLFINERYSHFFKCTTYELSDYEVGREVGRPLVVVLGETSEIEAGIAICKAGVDFRVSQESGLTIVQESDHDINLIIIFNMS